MQQQRPLRLGDIVDDYCPRERRLTNHAIVAVVEQTIRQTRCTTCDAEHVYKGGKEPRRKKKGSDDLAMADAAAGQLVMPRTAGANARPENADVDVEIAPDLPPPDTASVPETVLEPIAVAAAPEPAAAVEPAGDEPAPEREFWPAHRQLIRATLPRTEGDTPPARPIPEFTMHQRPHGRGHRQGQPWHGGNGYSRNGFGGERDGNVAPRHGQGGRRRRRRGR